jgi:hypothetical protein
MEKEKSYEDLLSGTVKEVKEQVKEMDNPDYESIINAEKKDKNRSTLLDYLERQV